MKIQGFKPGLKKEHPYAVGLKNEIGEFCPIQSYDSLEELEEELLDLYSIASSKRLTIPIPVEKKDSETEWDGAQCLTLPETLDKIIRIHQGTNN